MEEKIEKTTCVSCGESVLSTEKFCKNCGKPLVQKSENNVVIENPNKKVVLTFEALDDSSINNVYGQDAKITYSIEVDGNFIGKINSGEKIDTFVTKGKRNIKLKRSKSFIPNEEQIWVEDNQTILLHTWYFHFPTFHSNPSDLEKEEMLQRGKKIAIWEAVVWALWKACLIIFAVCVILGLILLFVD